MAKILVEFEVDTEGEDGMAKEEFLEKLEAAISDENASVLGDLNTVVGNIYLKE